MLAPPKKKKLIRIIIIISGRVADYLDADPPNTTSTSEAALVEVWEAKAALYQLPDDEGSWSIGQEDAWNAADALAEALETGNPTENELDSMVDTLMTAVANL